MATRYWPTVSAVTLIDERSYAEVTETIGEHADHFRVAIVSLAEPCVKRYLNLCLADRVSVQLASQRAKLTLCERDLSHH